jgi:hypothetical protein
MALMTLVSGRRYMRTEPSSAPASRIDGSFPKLRTEIGAGVSNVARRVSEEEDIEWTSANNRERDN